MARGPRNRAGVTPLIILLTTFSPKPEVGVKVIKPKKGTASTRGYKNVCIQVEADNASWQWETPYIPGQTSRKGGYDLIGVIDSDYHKEISRE